MNETALAARCARQAIGFDVNEEYPPSKAELWQRSERAAGILRQLAQDIMKLRSPSEDKV